MTSIARAALDEVVAAATTRQRTSMRATLARTPVVQHRLGHALLARVYANDAWVAQLCASVVDTCFATNGASGIYDTSSLQRRLRDIHTIGQHASLNDNSLTRAGAALLGQPIDRWF